MAAPPTLTEIRDILKTSVSKVPDTELQSIIDSEYSQQSLACAVDPYTEDLRQAMIRRVHRALALKGAPLGIITGAGDTNTGVGRVSWNDREVERLEFQYLKKHIGMFGGVV